jgi:flagellar motor switch/type III secretory pathway protein FliN
LSHHETISPLEMGVDSDLGLKAVGSSGSAADTEPLGWLPRLTNREVRLERWLSSWSRDGRIPPFLDWLDAGCGGTIALERPEVLWRASGLNRPGLVAQFTAPRLVTRLAMGIENAVAHTIVDRLLGFDRSFAESRLQLTPVEWGVWTFLILRALDTMGSGSAREGPDGLRSLGAGGLTLDRAGPDPFDPSRLGPIVTVRWPIRVGTTTGAVRLWLPEPVVERWLDSPNRMDVPGPEALGGSEGSVGRGETVPRVPRAELSSLWRAEAGSVAMSQGLKRLRVGGVLPLTGSRLTGTPASPGGPIDLVLDLQAQEGRFRIPVQPVPDSSGRLVRLDNGLIHEHRPRDPILVNVKETRTMSQSSAGTNPPSVTAPEVAPLDVPVTLAVELGRVNLTLDRLADLRPGDVIELSRHSRAPVELTSNGRLVARGELILIDTDRGVWLTCLFFKPRIFKRLCRAFCSPR